MGSDWVHWKPIGAKHFKATAHPIIKSFEPGENWKWCYVDEIFMK
ncbi:MAG: hypothetical protein ACJ708_04135 [Nitrososphaeraceae archaeon]